jgi:dTDP-4-amino-4,6-dideoxygalactose transaminase
MPDIKIPMYNPLIETEEINRAVEALEMKWLGMGAYVKTFEEEVLNYLQCSKYSCAVSTGHAALHLALLLCDIKAGDEVLHLITLQTSKPF